MAIRIPTRERQVQQAGLPGYRQSSAYDSNGEQAVARGIQDLGQGVAGVGRALEAERARNDDAVLMEAYGRLQASRTAREQELQQKRGRDAGAYSTKALELFEKDVQSVEETLNARQRAAFQGMRVKESTSWQRAVNGHVNREMESFAAGAAKGAQEGAVQKAAAAARGGRPEEVQEAIRDGLSAVDLDPALRGQDQRLVNARRLEFTTAAHGTVLQELAAADLYKEAGDYLDAHKAEIDARVIGRLEERIKAAGLRGRSRDVADRIAAAATAGPMEFDLGEALRTAREDNALTKDPALYDAVVDRIRQRAGEVDAARRANDSPRVGRIDQSILAGKVGSVRSLQALPGFDELSDEGKATAMAHWRAKRAEGTEAQKRLDQLIKARFLAQMDPAQRDMDVDLDPLTRDGSELTRWQLRGYQKSLKEGGAKVSALKAQVDDYIVANSISTKAPGKGKLSDAQKLHIFIRKQWADWELDPANQGADPKPEDIAGFFAAAVRTGALKEGFWPWSDDEEIPAYLAARDAALPAEPGSEPQKPPPTRPDGEQLELVPLVAQVPDADRQMIVEAYRIEKGREPTESEIESQYRRLHP